MEDKIEVKIIELDKERVLEAIRKVFDALDEYTMPEQIAALELMIETYPQDYAIIEDGPNRTTRNTRTK